ncbi:MAG: DUF4339 domain-containing protein [Candidatus Hydrogenedens sp.]|jgi:hypothetical protein|nr:DUF4339 domain-containing protein [Candidatus Hydrogenedens sp.]
MSESDLSNEQPVLKEWHFITDNNQMGPFSLEEVEELATQEKINRTSLAWRDGMAEWQPIDQIQDLKQVIEKCLPPPLPPGALTSGSRPNLRKRLGEFGTKKVAPTLQKYGSSIKKTLGGSGDEEDEQRLLRTQQFQNLTVSDAIKYIIQFTDLNGYIIQEVRESEGEITITKGRSTFPITCREEDDNHITMEVTIQSSLPGHFPKERALNKCFDRMKSTMLSLQHGVSPTQKK